VLAAEHLPRFRGVHFQLESVERLCQLTGYFLTGPGPFDEHVDVVAAPAQGIEERSVLLETTAALHDFLRLALVAPEVWRCDAGLYLAELLVQPGTLKDASEVRRPVCSALRIDE
jgi:hypothetical protein